MKREELERLEKKELIEIILVLTAQVSELSAKVAELEARLKMNSKNSSKPPSSDGFNKAKSLRKQSGKKAGGQYGHEGAGLELYNEPNNYIKHEPEECVHCPSATICKAKKAVNETRHEIDINIETSTTAHQTIRLICPLLKKTLRGRFPDGINSTMQYGPNMQALAVSLNTIGMVSINRTHEILSGVFGVPISTGTIAAMVSNCAEKVASSANEIKEAIIEEPLINIDETGIRVDKQTVWAHTASTDSLTYIEVQPSRGKPGMDAIGILLAFFGTVIHDCWASYFLFTAIRHGLCNAHLLRELTAVVENAKQSWAQELIDLLLQMKDMKENLLIRNKQGPTPYFLRKYEQAYDKIMEDALAHNPIPVRDSTQKGRLKRGKTGSLVDRLILHKEKFLLFFTDFSVPFDNNQAERDIRMFKVKQKVSGCFRTMQGACDFAAIMSYTGTARKFGVSGFIAIKNAILSRPFSIIAN
jgi:transposase